MVRKQVLKLYRDIFRTIKDVPEEADRIQLRSWARNDFKANKHHTDEVLLNIFIILPSLHCVLYLLNSQEKELLNLMRPLSLTHKF